MTLTRGRSGYASGAVLAAAAGSLAVCHLLAPAWSRDAGLDVWNIWGEQQGLARAADEREVLQQDFDRLQQQIAANEWVVGEAAAGRVSLADAADQIGEINAGRPGYLYALRHAHGKAGSDRRVYARQVIAMAARRPVPADTLARLEGDFRALPW